MTPGPKVEMVFSCLRKEPDEKPSQFEARPRMRKEPERADFEWG